MSSKNKDHFRGQLEFSFDRPKENDRNFHLGGKSFYFFDFDDNIAYLSTPIILFHKIDGHEVELSSGEFARNSKLIGKQGAFKDYFIEFNDRTGSFRNFRDIEKEELKNGDIQPFVRDVELALKRADYDWKAPSWQCFYHATFNERPMSLITARGHGRETIKSGISRMVQTGHLPHDPNYLGIYAVSHPDVKRELGDHELTSSVPELKRGAIRKSVETALDQYGHSEHHRFGMSDDDPHNIELIVEEMKALKTDYPEMSFFVIETFEDSFRKMEILQSRTEDLITQAESRSNQSSLFSAF